MIRTSILPSIALVVLAASVGAGQVQPDPKPKRFPAADTGEAWLLLRGDDPPLPAWALALAKPLPRTTAAMLQLDYVHRAKNPLGPVLASKLHWAAADALGCAYGKRYAVADLRRAGLKDDDFKALSGDPNQLPAEDQAALAFARKLTLAAYQVTDAEVAQLLELFGPEKVTAMVHTLAWANFRNRICLALGVAVEAGGPLPPLDSTQKSTAVAPTRPPWKQVQAAETPWEVTAPTDWRKLSAAELRTALEQQKARKPRIPLPDPSRLVGLPPAAKAQASKIVWTNVSMGYQPLLTQTWFETMQTFQQEAKLDRVFSQSMFWVITRGNECFY